MQVFVLVDVLLLVILVVLVAQLPSRMRADAGPVSTPAPSAPAATATAGGGDGTDPVAFSLPSGNITCEMSAEGVLCTIGSFTYAAPQVTGCEAETGHVVRLDDDGFRFECEDDGVPSVPQGAELAYGSRESVGAYTCASGTDGVTCLDDAGVGFRLARAQWTTLP
ncbi:hypothetical protein [Cellulomonas phragmiteti]|uniref:Ig-like domain-containing protein n=1 Tax=Cellulomonas phragmiteti TaxID=478780 RepID=A0ABQ4DG83_9CELL|nr:hypothetical protein [Cellulomonas phragmiteti]GIG38342.1 hypothetical protein Cph01nite_01040 [Cellulomonas phragmiteti]